MKLKIFILFLISVVTLEAQTEDTQGTDFWLTFMPNAHVGAFDQDLLKIRDSLYIFISSNLETNVYFEYKDWRGTTYYDTIYIDDIFQYFTFKVPYWDFELHDYEPFRDNRWGRPGDNVGKIAPQSFHVSSDEPITVIAHNQAKWSSDGMIIYPTERLGTKYFTHGYNGFSDRSPQFSIVATEDETTVLIDPTDDIYYFDPDEFPLEITLNKGDVFLVQGDMETGFNPDLAGSYIESDKPIAVFSGNERAMVPFYSDLSKDCLLGQMIPLESNGIEYIIFPLVKVLETSQSARYDDIYRVVAFYDDTEIWANDELITLDRGEVHEGIVKDPIHLQANSTISVSQYKKSTSSNGGNGWGDPFMLLNPAIEQYFTSYKVINFQASEFQNINYATDVYEVSYVSIIARDEFKDNILFDFQPLPDTLTWLDVPGTEWVISNLRTEIGTHLLSSDTTFGCFTYGYGAANSYGFVGGGMKLKKLDHERPVIQGTNGCDFWEGFATDSTQFDSGIDRIELSLESSNLVVKYDPIDSAKYVDFRVELLNPYYDGIGEIIVFDEFGISKKYPVTIPGYTLGIEGSENNVVDENTGEPGIPAIRKYCFDYTIRNYGNFDQEISEIRTSSPEFTVDTPLPIIIQPGQTADIQVCFFSDDVEGVFNDSLIISNGCTDRKIIQYKVNAWTDLRDPVVNEQTLRNCEERIYLVELIDSTEFDYGIVDHSYQLDNFKINESIDLSPDMFSYELEVEDVYQDAFFEFNVEDEAGNISNYRKEVPGFTLNINGESINRFELNFDERMIGTTICDSVEISNYGNYPLNFAFGDIEVNKLFSVPASQFPIALAPGESKFFTFCYNPVEIRDVDDLDSLAIYFNQCLSSIFVLKGRSVEFNTTSNSRCDLTLQLKANEIPNKAFLEAPYPNPASTSVQFIIGNSDQGILKADLFTSNGVKVMDLFEGSIPAGFHQLEIDLNDIPNGVFLYRFMIGNEVFTGTLIINN